ncbi:MAG TPA: cupin domain-containing protein [Casimicrobiaceae bacterium]|nr:cupin domain-containing protein [Casimicrobiaceae bacterium]
MEDLGTLKDLPTDYVEALRRQNLVPLWPSLRSLLPPDAPRSATRPTHWSWQAIRPLLLRAGELTPIEKAERRVLVLANPGRGLENLQASSAIYLGMQLVQPGEVAPNHRHTPNAARIVVEGTGACTIVGGERCAMAHGDLVLTPSGLWHEHRHEGEGPFIWLDVLDLPLMVYLDVSYVIQGEPQKVRRDPATYAAGGVLPRIHGRATHARYPLMRYDWLRTRAALEALAETTERATLVEVAYVNPETGGDCLNTVAFSAFMLRPGETQSLPRMSAARVLHVVEGGGSADIDGTAVTLDTADTLCAPGFSTVRLANGSARAPLFIIVADESPIHRKLGVLEVREPASA